MNINKNTNIEMLRIFSMLMIVSLHVLFRGGALENINQVNINFTFAWLLEAIAYTSVDMFVLITGYLCIDKCFKSKRILQIITITLFYSWIFLILQVLIFKDYKNINSLITSILPISTGHYWFVTTYILLAIFYPFINKGIENISLISYRIIILLGIVCFSIIPTFMPLSDINISLNGGTNLLWFIVLYLIGGYIRKFGANMSSISSFKIALVNIIIVFSSKIIVFMLTTRIIGREIGSAVWYHHNSIFILLASIFIFIGFINLNNKQPSKLILKFSKLAFGVYIIHENIYIKEIIWPLVVKYQELNKLYWPIFVIFIILVIYLSCSFIEYIRLKLFELIRINNFIDTISWNIDNKLITLIYKYRSSKT